MISDFLQPIVSSSIFYFMISKYFTAFTLQGSPFFSILFCQLNVAHSSDNFLHCSISHCQSFHRFGLFTISGWSSACIWQNQQSHFPLHTAGSQCCSHCIFMNRSIFQISYAYWIYFCAISVDLYQLWNTFAHGG